MDNIADLLDILARPSGSRDHRRRLCAPRTVRRPRRSGNHRPPPTSASKDLIAPQDMVVTLSHTGYFKRQPLTDHRAQRGGRGKQAAAVRTMICRPAVHRQHPRPHPLLLQPRPRLLAQGVQRAEGNRNSRGKPIVNLFPLLTKREDHRHAAGQGVRRRPLHCSGDRSRVHPLKKTRSPTSPTRARLASSRSTWTKRRLVSVAITDGQHDMMMFSTPARPCAFRERRAPMGRQARGVRGMMLEDGWRRDRVLVSKRRRIKRAHSATENGFVAYPRSPEYTELTAAAPRA